ncbi:hypothetical protein ACFLZ1_03370 [Patescibacteria group bacterium]
MVEVKAPFNLDRQIQPAACDVYFSEGSETKFYTLEAQILELGGAISERSRLVDEVQVELINEFSVDLFAPTAPRRYLKDRKEGMSVIESSGLIDQCKLLCANFWPEARLIERPWKNRAGRIIGTSIGVVEPRILISVGGDGAHILSKAVVVVFNHRTKDLAIVSNNRPVFFQQVDGGWTNIQKTDMVVALAKAVMNPAVHSSSEISGQTIAYTSSWNNFDRL